MLNVNNGVIKLLNRTFCTLCLKFRGIVATVYYYFEGADSSYRLGRLRSVTGGYRECRRCVGIVADGSDTELCTYG